MKPRAMPCGGDAFQTGPLPIHTAHILGFDETNPDCSWCDYAEGNGGPCGPIPAALPVDMKAGNVYRGSDGRWYHSDGRLVPRAERRKAGVK